MIEIVQAGQYGKARLLFDMHRLRRQIFHDRLKWPVQVLDELEIDQFDLPEAVYILYLDGQRRVTGTLRLLPTTGPTMMRDVWPHFLESLPMPSAPYAWEISRFTIAPFSGPDSKAEAKQALAEIFLALAELTMRVGIREIYSFYDNRIARVIRRIDCVPQKLSQSFDIDCRPAQLGKFVTGQQMLARIRNASGIRHSVLADYDLPPCFSLSAQKELSHAG